MPSLLGTPPVVGKRSEFGAAINLVADSTAQATPGHIAFAKDASERWSVLRYYKAAATIAIGAPLIQDTGSRDPNQLLTATTGEAGQNLCRGFAAAAVSNTGYFSWAYIAGYCPDVAMPTLYASNQPLRLSATYAGRLSSTVVNASLICTGATWANHITAYSLSAATVSTSNSTNSAAINGWLM